MAVAIQYMMVTYVFFFIACSSTIAIAVYLFTITATTDIIDNLHLINEDANSNKKPSNISTQISEFIEYHSILKQLSQCDIYYNTKILLIEINLKMLSSHRSIDDILKVFQPKCLILLSWSIVLLCGTMLTIQIVIIQFVI